MENKNLPSWRDNPAPLIPVYFIDIIHLKQVIENRGISEYALELLLGYYLEFEMFEKAAVIRDFFTELEEEDVDTSILKQVLESPKGNIPSNNDETKTKENKNPGFDPFEQGNPFL